MIIEILRKVHHLDLVTWQYPRIYEELRFTESIDWAKHDSHLYFINLKGLWNKFTLGQINIMASYGANYDAAVYTWTVKRTALQNRRIELPI